MAWSFAAVDSDYVTWKALNYPMMVVQKIPVSPSYAKWVEHNNIGSGTIATWTDESTAATPSRWVYDGYIGKYCVTGATPDDVMYFCFDFGAPITFDCAMLIGHNFGTLDLGNDVLLQIADDNDFTTSLTTVGNFGTPAANDDSRLSDFVLSHGADGGRTHDTSADAGPNAYTAQYVWVKVDKTGTDITPYLGELILGSRYQTKTNPLNGWDRDALHDDIARTKTIGGVTHTTVYNENQHILSARFPAWETDRIADFKAWFKNSRGSFVWVAQPNDAPADWQLITKPSDLSMPSAEFTEREVTISGEEQGPEEYWLENE